MEIKLGRNPKDSPCFWRYIQFIGNSCKFEFSIHRYRWFGIDTFSQKESEKISLLDNPVESIDIAAGYISFSWLRTNPHKKIECSYG